jgi:hypothetical protein
MGLWGPSAVAEGEPGCTDPAAPSILKAGFEKGFLENDFQK